MVKTLDIEKITIQTEKITKSNIFSNSPLMIKLLEYLVDKSIETPDEKVTQFEIGVSVLNKSQKNFDPTYDPIIRIHARRLRKYLQRYYDVSTDQNEIVIAMPKGQYGLTFNYPQFTYAEKIEKSHNEDFQNTIAISDFKDFRIKRHNDDLTNYLKEDILLELSLFKHFNVLNSHEDSRFLIDGFLTNEKEKFRISIKLIDQTSSQIIWSKNVTFQYSEEEILSLEESIAKPISRTIADVNGIICGRMYSQTDWTKKFSLNTYSTYLHFYKYHINSNEETATELIPIIEKLVNQEPNFASGWAILCNLYADLFVYTLDKKTLSKALESGRKSVNQDANDQNGLLHYAYALMLNNQIHNAKKLIEQLLNLNNNALFYTGCAGWLYCLMGDFSIGFKLLSNTIKRNPLSPEWFYIGTFIYYVNENEIDMAHLEALKMNDHNLIYTPLLKLISFQLNGSYSKAKKQLPKIIALKPDFEQNYSNYICCLFKHPQTQDILISSIQEIINA